MNLIKFSILVVLGAILFIFTRPEKLPMMELQVNHQGEPSDFRRSVGGSCEFERCLTVYLSPSCPTSPRITSMLISLVAELKEDGIKTDIIVGNDPSREVAYFAKKYPFDVLLDARGSFFYKAKLEFTPSFIVTNEKGEIINKQTVTYNDVPFMRSKLEL